MKTKEALINIVSSLSAMELNDSDEDTDDDFMNCTSSFMVRSTPVDPPEMHDFHISLDPPESTCDSGDTEDVIQVQAHFEYSTSLMYKDRTYAISDGGADSCILEKMLK